ncbi:MAG TPA: maleylpyruvate isomerase family mycothiol-dependent enzyme [Streptosporangiaceae bacterium]|jgi:uncharacterized protein (TIGR03083 family)
MAQISTERYHGEIERATGTLAALVDGADLSRRVPTCPDWTIRQLATHVGRAHRWAAEITRTRSAQVIPFREVPDGRLPDDPAEHRRWLNAGASRLTGALREAGDEPVWAFGDLRPASAWARRMTHETNVHLSDGELAAGAPVSAAVPADIAADGVDEWLGFMSGPVTGGEHTRTAALPDGRVLHVHATDDGLDGSGEWLVSNQGGGITVEPGHGRGDAALTGPAARLQLALVRRLPLTDDQLTVFGDDALLTAWLANTPY